MATKISIVLTEQQISQCLAIALDGWAPNTTVGDVVKMIVTSELAKLHLERKPSEKAWEKLGWQVPQ